LAFSARNSSPAFRASVLASSCFFPQEFLNEAIGCGYVHGGRSAEAFLKALGELTGINFAEAL
jgi:hypothetical protein